MKASEIGKGQPFAVEVLGMAQAALGGLNEIAFLGQQLVPSVKPESTPAPREPALFASD